MKTQYSLLIDVGGTDIKVGVVEDGLSNLIRVDRYPTPPFLNTRISRKEISPAELLLRCKMAISSAERSFGTFTSVALSGQMGCWVLTDYQNNPLTNIISWQDKRVEETIPQRTSIMELAEEIYGENGLRLAGNEVRSGLPIFGMYQHFQNDKVERKVRFHSLISWLSSQLVSEYPYIVHETDFASSGMYNLKAKNILNSIDELFKGKIVFPQVTDEYLTLEGSKIEQRKFFIGVGDQQASLYGSQLSNKTIVINIGTGGQVATLQLSSGVNGNTQVRPFFNGELIETLTHLPAGRALTAYAKVLLANTSEKLNYDPFFNLRISDFKTIRSRDIDNFEVDVPIILKSITKEEIQILTEEVVYGYFRSYRDAIRNLNHKGCTTLIFAGGVGQKFLSLQHYLGKELKMNTAIANTNESTLQGLAFLMARDK